jgi:VWA domain-containing protein
VSPRPHLITTPEPAPTAATSAPWLRLSAAFTAHAEELSGRDDLTVTCAPGVGRGAPGCYVPALACIELDGTHLGHPPASCDPTRPSDRDRYPALWGVFVHESAHAAHSRWNAPGEGSPAAYLQAALLLEESRIEAAHLRRRPADRHWLRACTRELVIGDFTPPQGTSGQDNSSTAGSSTAGSSQAGSGRDGSGAAQVGEAAGVRVAMTPWDAGRTAALLLARVDAGVLDEDETTTLKAAVTDVLGPSRLSALAALWHIAHATADDDAEAMLDLGRRWCTILDVVPAEPPPEPEGSGPGQPSVLADAVTTTLGAVVSADAPPAPPSADRARRRREEQAAQRRSAQAARGVFDPKKKKASGRVDVGSHLTGSRRPTSLEQAAARRLARALRAAAHRERVAVQATSATPPGRLRMRGALAAAAQRAAGVAPTAEPFVRTTYRHVPTPPLRVGVACDVSGSMSSFEAPVASAAWILARAVGHIPDARAASVIFGRQVQPLTYPAGAPTRVHTFTARGRDEAFTQAVDALDAALELTRPGAARLLVIISDGNFFEAERTSGQRRITRLVAAGCAVLWLAPHSFSLPMQGAQSLIVADPAEAIEAIGKAATKALRHT